MVLLFPVVVFGQITEYPVPASSSPWQITAGPDGALWFGDPSTNRIGRITTAGTVTYYGGLTGSQPGAIVSGPDGNLWFVEQLGGKVGRMTTGGVLTEFPIGPYYLAGIAAGPDGNLWISIFSGNYSIVKMSTAGVVLNTYPLVAPAGTITAGPDGNLWFVEPTVVASIPGWIGRIGRITTAGVVTEFAIPTAAGYPVGITTGPDGALWFTEESAAKVGRITTAGVVTEFNVAGEPKFIAAGSDGALWFAEGSNNKIGRITTSGVFTDFALPSASSNPFGVASGPDGRVWVTEPGVAPSPYGGVGSPRSPRIAAFDPAVLAAGVSVPAMSKWMLMLLALVVAAVGVRAAKGW